MTDTFFTNGWKTFPFDPALAAWLKATAPAAFDTVRDPANAEWLRCGGTWFAGVNVLNNDATGAVPGGPPVTGRAVDFLAETLGLAGFTWDKAQVSVCYPGYPQPWEGESEKAFGYRRNRDAAHVDGLLKDGPERRRFLREHHGFILGIPLTDHSPGAAPLVVWEGSHEVVRGAFAERFSGLPPDDWALEDVTDAYHAVRRRIFDTCRRVEIHARPGEAYVVHRLALHGIAPWADGASAPADHGRAILYFRPGVLTPGDWLNAR